MLEGDPNPIGKLRVGIEAGLEASLFTDEMKRLSGRPNASEFDGPPI